MNRELRTIQEAYERQLITEGWIWDGLKWIWRRIVGGDRTTDVDTKQVVGTVDTNSDTPKTQVYRERAGFHPFGKGESPVEFKREVKKYSPSDYNTFLKLTEREDTEWYWLTYKDRTVGIDKRDIVGMACVSHERLSPTVRVFATSKRATADILALCRSKLVKAL